MKRLSLAFFIIIALSFFFFSCSGRVYSNLYITVPITYQYAHVTVDDFYEEDIYYSHKFVVDLAYQKEKTVGIVAVCYDYEGVEIKTVTTSVTLKKYKNQRVDIE